MSFIHLYLFYLLFVEIILLLENPTLLVLQTRVYLLSHQSLPDLKKMKIYQIYHKSLQLTNLLIPYHDHLLLQVIQVKKHHLVYHRLWLHQIYQNMPKAQL